MTLAKFVEVSAPVLSKKDVSPSNSWLTGWKELDSARIAFAVKKIL